MSELDALDLMRVMKELREIKGSHGRRLLEIRDRGFDRAKTKIAYEQERARVRNRTPGSVQAKDDAAALDPECDRLRVDMERAKIIETYVKDVSDSFSEDQSNLQTQAGLVKDAMRLAGVPNP